MASSSRLTPRQKMINLMYIVFLAMVALNVSSDVLHGFEQVEDSLAQSNEGIMQRNAKLYAELAELNRTNPEKASFWYKQSQDVKQKSDSIYEYVESLKKDIVFEADGEDADLDSIINQENLEATNFVMLSPAVNHGLHLRKAIDMYRDYLLSKTGEDSQSLIKNTLDTDVSGEGSLSEGRTWEQKMFENMPVAAAVTMLTKIQNDIRSVEGETISSLRNAIDDGDIRVNKVEAFVIPSSRNVMQGSTYTAHIVLAAIDSTEGLDIYIDDQLMDSTSNGIFKAPARTVGVQTLKGHIEVPTANGLIDKLPFETQYIVQEPTATVSNTMMNVMYAGIDNPVSISVPGIASSDMSATMSNGTLKKVANGWIAKPTKVGEEAVITVRATQDGQTTVVANTKFRVRQLPDPRPYISIKDADGNVLRYKGGKPVAKSQLLRTSGLNAAIDDDLLDVDFKVLSFETVFFDAMGNAMPELSNGASFSDRQMQAFKRIPRGKRFYISKVRAIGPDGVERTLSPMEVIVN